MGPDRKPYFAVGRGNKSCIIADFNGRTKDLHIPGAYKGKISAKGFKVWAKEVIRIEFLKFKVGSFYKVGSVVSVQNMPLLLNNKFQAI